METITREAKRLSYIVYSQTVRPSCATVNESTTNSLICSVCIQLVAITIVCGPDTLYCINNKMLLYNPVHPIALAPV